MFELPKVGDMLRLFPVTVSQEKQQDEYKSRIADIKGNVAEIEVPIHTSTGRMASPTIGMQWNVSYMGEGGSKYDFTTIVMGTKKDNIPLLLIQIPDKEQIIRTQRRDYLRVPLVAQVALKVKNVVGEQHFVTKTIDLSGGGLGVTWSKTYKLFEKDQVQIWLAMQLRNGTVLHAFSQGEITRIKVQEENDYNWASIKFIKINETDQAKVVRVCYERQLELHKKEK